MYVYLTLYVYSIPEKKQKNHYDMDRSKHIHYPYHIIQSYYTLTYINIDYHTLPHITIHYHTYTDSLMTISHTFTSSVYSDRS